jgi:hypothetical protein
MFFSGIFSSMALFGQNMSCDIFLILRRAQDAAGSSGKKLRRGLHRRFSPDDAAARRDVGVPLQGERFSPCGITAI